MTRQSSASACQCPRRKTARDGAISSKRCSHGRDFARRGRRYWHFESKGSAHFEAPFTNGVPQSLDFKANLYGVFMQGSYRFDAF